MDKKITIRLTLEEQNMLDYEAKKLGISVPALVKLKSLRNVESSSLIKDENVVGSLETIAGFINDSMYYTDTTNIMIKLVLEQTWTILQTINASSDSEGRKVILKMIDLSKEHVEKLIEKSRQK